MVPTNDCVPAVPTDDCVSVVSTDDCVLVVLTDDSVPVVLTEDCYDVPVVPTEDCIPMVLTENGVLVLLPKEKRIHSIQTANVHPVVLVEYYYRFGVIQIVYAFPVILGNDRLPPDVIPNLCYQILDAIHWRSSIPVIRRKNVMFLALIGVQHDHQDSVIVIARGVYSPWLNVRAAYRLAQ